MRKVLAEGSRGFVSNSWASCNICTHFHLYGAFDSVAKKNINFYIIERQM